MALRALALLTLALAASAVPARAQPAFAPPNSPATAGLPASCAELVNGTTGGSGRPPGAPVPVNPGPATVPLGVGDPRLPRVVAFRGTRESFNQRYDVAARRGGLYLRGHAGDGRGTGPWRRLTLPPCMEGRVREVAIDRDVLIAIDGRRNLYSSGNALEPVERLYESWTMRWGPVLWSGAGVRLPAGTRAWNASGLTTADDRWFLDGARRRQDVIGVATVYALGGDGSRITYLDPWLPSDESYEVCAPRRGRFRAVALAGSGSTVLLQGRAGELYTRQYDFDISGADIAQLRYSWEDQRGVADPAIQLPPLGWRRQPDIPGRPTTRISIHTTGAGSLARVLRVEGLDRRGRRGYWEKRIAGPRWRFVATGLSLRGRLLAANARPAPLVPARAAGYAGRLADGTRVELRGFHPYCSPAPLRLIAPSGRRVTLTLHTVDGLRQAPLPRGLSHTPREQYGALEAPPELRRGLARRPAAVRRLVRRVLGPGRRLRTTNVHATRGTLWIDALCWRLRRTGARVPAGDNPPPTGCAGGPSAR